MHVPATRKYIIETGSRGTAISNVAGGGACQSQKGSPLKKFYLASLYNDVSISWPAGREIIVGFQYETFVGVFR